MPVIAITQCASPHDYEASVLRAGGEAWMLDRQRDTVEEVLRRADGLVLTGGGDIDPRLYGATPDPSVELAEPGRDAYELALVQQALDADLPVLAICRGLQVLNVARGGTLIQDLPTVDGRSITHRVREPRTAMAHDVWVTSGSLLDQLMHERETDDTLAVNSRHHQAADAVGTGLVVTATAPDGVIEAVEDPSRRFCLGVQWHPENFYRTGEFSALFEGLVRRTPSRSRSGR